MAVGKDYYNQTIERYQKNSQKKIGGWIAMLSIGTVLFFGGFTMMTLGIVYEIIALIVVGPILASLVGLPMMTIGTVFLVLFIVKRSVARGKIRRAKREIDNLEKTEVK